MPYPNGPLKSRSVVRPGVYALLSDEGRVTNVIPNIEGCQMTILCTPKIGAGFVQYIGTAQPGGGTKVPFGREKHIETFVYFLDGEGSLEVKAGDKSETFGQGGYAYAPAGTGISFKNVGTKPLRFLLYKQAYIPHPDDPKKGPWAVLGNVNGIKERIYDGMHNVFVRDLLPVDEAFDMNMHILAFEPGGCHPFIETHVQEHGAYIYEGQGMYLLGDDWLAVQRDDFLWMGAYAKQACYATGTGRLSYIYSKDCHRDVAL